MTRENVPKAKAPTDAQVAALKELQSYAKDYQRDARDYRRTLTRIIKHHYQQKRRRILSSIDSSLKFESKALRKARVEAIKRLEGFVAKYRGNNAHPQNTPDAMFRLAALYEERARDEAADAAADPGMPPPAPNLAAAVRLYKRIVNDFPRYAELAGVFYYLGHAYNDMGRIEEAQQVWRSLVCRNRFRYPVPPDPRDPEKDSIGRLPQDHDGDWWLGWLSRHPEPLDKVRAKREAEGKTDEAAAADDEESFIDPYPTSCKAIAQKPILGKAPRYIAEIWWRLGDYHFDEIDVFGGPYNLNRADSAYRQAMKFKRPPVFDVAMYKRAWTYFKQQRYRDAVGMFVKLLRLTDRREKETGNAGADFRKEAYAYIAGSITYQDFDGPGAGDPYLARNDVFDLYSDPAQIEEAMRQAIKRVQDASLIPQKKQWTVQIYKALAYEFKEYGQLHNLIEVSKLVLKKWPFNRDAPFTQAQIADTYETLAQQARGSEARKYTKLALQARGNLVNYVEQPGNIPEWVERNKEDPEAVRAAERLVRSGLYRAAADHTNAGRRFKQIARTSDDAAEKQLAIEQGLGQYRAASKAWGAYLRGDPNADDAYDSRYWLADSYTNIVLLKVTLGKLKGDTKQYTGLPNDDADCVTEEQARTCTELRTRWQAQVCDAQRTAREVRDSNEDDEKLQPAGMMVVRAAQQVVVSNYDLNAQGVGGFPEVKEVTVQETSDGENSTTEVVKRPLPDEIRSLITAFDEYVARVPLSADPYKNQNQFAYQAGEITFLYGHFEEARKRLLPIYVAQCGKNKFGYDAWLKLVTMANLQNNFAESLKLSKAAKKKSCAYDDATKLREKAISGDTIKTGFYKEAYKAFQKAQKMEDGPERTKMWKKAASLYEGALTEAPSHQAAPEAAINGAIAYKQLGAYDKAIGMYELFIKEYGSDDKLSDVKNGNKEKGIKADPKQYEERVGYLKQAYGALADAYVLFFDYRRAARTYDKMSAIKHFDAAYKRTAARNAVFLYANIGDRERVATTKQRFFSMQPPPSQSEKAELEWLIAKSDVKDWDERSPDRGDNRKKRQAAIVAMEKFYQRWTSDSTAAKFTVQAAYLAAKLYRAGNAQGRYAKWCSNTRSAFSAYKSVAGVFEKSQRNKALGSIQADMAAECHFRSLDKKIKKDFDYDAGHHRYSGVITEVTGAFKKDIEEGAKEWFDKLQDVVTTYESRRWTIAAWVRQGSLYDSCRTGLYSARAPGLKLYTPKEEKILKKLDKLCVEDGIEDACTKYDAFTAKRRMAWRKKRDNDLAAADTVMANKYTTAIQWAKDWKVRVGAVDQAIGRLAFYTDIIGDGKLRTYTANVKDTKGNDFSYQDGMFLRMRRGMTVATKPTIVAAPLPANPN